MDNGQLLGGRYRLQARLGAGGMSVVWRAYDEVLGRDVAVKVLHPDLAAGPDLVHRIHAEARAAAGLRHRHVVEVYDYGEAADDGPAVPYVVMELLDGRPLADLLTGGPLPWRLAVLVCAQVAAALATAHARGVVHRDVKPGNVMVTADGVKLVDFGISAAVGAADGNENGLLGTPAYLAPERLDGGQVRPATDVYALGLLLYRCLAGRLPWRAATTTQMLNAHRYQDPAVVPPVAGLPAEVADLCGSCLAKDPEDRPAAADVAAILADIAGLPTASLLQSVADAAPADPREATVTYQMTPLVRPAANRFRPGRRTLVVAAGAAALLTLGGVTAVMSDRSPESPAAAGAAVAAPQPACTVRYAIRSTAGGTSSTAVTILNTGTAPVAGWQLTFDLPAGQQLLRGWSDRWQQTGTSVRARGGDLAAGASVATGFDAAYRDVTAVPSQFLLNGTACRSDLSIAGTPDGLPGPAPQPGAKTAAAQPAGAAAAAGAADQAAASNDAKGNSGKGSTNSGKGKGKGSGKGGGKKADD